jgi:hypothetical protein
MPRLWRGPVRPFATHSGYHGRNGRSFGQTGFVLIDVSGRYVAARGREGAEEHVTGGGASLEGDHVCAAMERAITQQPADRGGINVVGASDISLRLATGQPLQCFLPLMRRHLARPSEPNTPLLRSLAAFTRAGAD